MKCVPERLRNKFEGKTIALVGGAKKRVSQLILDQYDYIIQINYKPRLKRFHGLYLSYDCAPVVDGKIKPEFVIFNTCAAHTGCIDKVTELYQRPGIELFPYCHHEAWLRRLRENIGAEPLTGCVALMHFINLGARKIFLTGFDLYSKNFEIPYEIGIHNIVAHYGWLKWVKDTEYGFTDKEIEYDETLKQVLKGDPYRFPVKRSVPV